MGIAGLLGSGRTELLRVLAGLSRPSAGTVYIDEEPQPGLGYDQRLKRGLGFTPESRKEDGVIPELGVDENTVCTDLSKVSSNGMLSWPNIREATNVIIRRMSIKAPGTAVRVASLSAATSRRL